MLNKADSWNTLPDLSAGVLAVSGVDNRSPSSALDARSRELENQLRSRYDGFDRARLREEPALAAYHGYYKRFKKSYHVQLQLESVVLKNQEVQSPSSLVQAMFLAELRNHLLTSGHDLDLVEQPLTIAAADGTESYLRINNQPQSLKPLDLFIRDRKEILSSIIYGPDRRTRIQPHTTRVLYTVYGVPGIEPASIQEHLEGLRDLIFLASPSASLKHIEVFSSRG